MSDQQVQELQLHNDLREVWALVTDRPGIALRSIAKELDVTLYRVRYLVELLKESGTLAARAGHAGHGTLHAPIPLYTIRREDTGIG